MRQTKTHLIFEASFVSGEIHIFGKYLPSLGRGPWIGWSPRPGFQSPPGLIYFSRGSQPKPSFATTVDGWNPKQPPGMVLKPW